MTDEETVARKIIEIIDAYESCDSSPVEAIEKYCKKVIEKQESVSDDLEDAANYYVKSTLVGSPYVKKNAFKTGAHWKEKQMMSKAIEAHVFGKEFGLPLYCFKGDNKDAICGQTVKISILKNE